MLTGKQKKYLRSLGNSVEAIMQIGKGGVGENLLKTVDDALEARELVKLSLLNNCPEDIGEVAGRLAEYTGAEVVQIIGSKILLYRESERDPRIVLPRG